MGLVVFAGDAVVQLPITSDYRMAKAFARRISPSMVSVQGTDIGQALSLATMSFSEREITPQDASSCSSPTAKARLRRHRSGRTGRRTGHPHLHHRHRHAGRRSDPDRRRVHQGRQGRDGRIETGRTPARKDRTGDRRSYIRSTNQSIGLDEIVRTINNMEKGDLAALRFEEFNEQFQYLIGAALVLLLLEFLLLDRRNPLLRRFNIFGTDTEK